MRVFIIKSSEIPMPLAEVRTDGKNLEFIVDNTGGKLPHMAQNSFERLKDIIDTSHHLSLERPQHPAAHLLRYVLSNGDSIAITTDGQTALLNGEMLTEKQKLAFFEALRGGHLKVISQPHAAVPVLPGAPPVRPREPSRKVDKGLIEWGQEQNRRDYQKFYGGNFEYDPQIEESDFDGGEGFPDIKNFLYWLKYGKRK